VVKKIASSIVTRASYPKNNVTNILSDPLTKTTDARPVYFTQNLAGLDTIGKTSENRAALARVFPYPIMVESRRRKRNKISRFTSINAHTNLVPFNRLLVNHLLLGGTNYINCDRPQSVGVYQSFYARSHLAQKSHSIILVFVT
jgi:hypothetical protein